MFSARVDTIDGRLRDAIGGPPTGLMIHRETLPAYRFVDLFHAVEAYVAKRSPVTEIDAQSNVLLSMLLFDKPQPQYPHRIIPAAKSGWKTGPDTEANLPSDRFWVVGQSPGNDLAVIRLRYVAYSHTVELDVAQMEAAAAAETLRDLVDTSARDSVYRSAMVTLDYVQGKRNEYGDVEQPEHLSVGFSEISVVPESEIILSPEQIRLLERNMIDLAEKRDLLAQHGVPTKRGMLLHGPPGTGKTYACRYMCHRMEGVTRIFLTGSALNRVSAVFGLARLYQPSVIFIEDADLMFASREVNLYSTTLGELMDQMDGLRDSEEISIVMTTNAIERIEDALKDRPGRISQCIYMGAPNAVLRRRFLEKHLETHDTRELDFDRLVEDSRGATQAFLKEWVYRSVQVGCEALEGPDDPLTLTQANFREALREMNSDGGEAGARIVGFAAGFDPD